MRKNTPAVSINKSVTRNFIYSLENGKPYRYLRRHLSNIGMTEKQYLRKWGLPSDYPMVSKAASSLRSKVNKTRFEGSAA